MNNCKHCNKEITTDGDFCGNCGFINFYEEEDVFKRLMKQFKYIFINPVTFIRTSRLANPIFTAFTALMIILIELIIIKGMGKKLGLNIPAGYTILITIGMTAVAALFMFVIANIILKKSINFMAFLNLTLSGQLIFIIINVIGALLGVLITPHLFTIFSAFGIIISLLLMYQGIKDYVKDDIKTCLVTMIGSFVGTTLIMFIVLEMLLEMFLKNALRSIF